MDGISEAEMVALIREIVKTCGTQYAAARRLGVEESYISNVLTGIRSPGPAICAALGYTRVHCYQRVEDQHASK
jgi:DNA-binding transcriptional regulator YdaS (Cro superfamily)